MSLLPVPPDPRSAKVVSLSPALTRRQFRQKHRWDLTKEHLDWIATDVWGADDMGSSKISVAKGKEPKRPPLSSSIWLSLPQPDARPSIILRDELHAGCFKGGDDLAGGSATAGEIAAMGLEPPDCWKGDRLQRELPLRPSEHNSGRLHLPN